MTGAPLDPVAEETEALDRIARTHDGALLHRHLRRILETVFDAPESGALLSQNGRRSLAKDLMRHMAEGISASGISGSSDPILSRGTGVAVRARARGIARRVGPSEPYADSDAPAADASSGAGQRASD